MNLNPGTFATFTLDELQEKQGQILTPLNKAVLQNLMAEAADYIVGAVLPTSDAELANYRQEVLFAQARIRIIKELLNNSDLAEKYLQEVARAGDIHTPVSGNVYDVFKPQQ